MNQLKINFVTSFFILTGHISFGQKSNWFCSADPIISKDLVYSYSWKNLPAEYKIIRQDTICGKNKYTGRILYNGKLVAIGGLNKNNVPNGEWFIEPKEEYSSCWGKMRNGYKKGTWWCRDSFFIKFDKNGNVHKGHTLP
jgi:hypothetical protein